VTSSQITVGWTASTDNVGVTAYQVYRGGVFRATATGVSYTDTGLTALTSYTYTVAACDAAGNCSAQSTSTSATTLSAGSGIFTPNLELGWNLMGNSLNTTINVASIFGNQDSPVSGVSANIASVWKWDATNQQWAFYSPQLTVAGIASFAAGKGYSVLSSVNAGEGYWVNAITPISLPVQTGTNVTWSGFSFAALPSAWNLIATASAVTPSQFNSNVSISPPAPGTVPTDNFVSLWAWDAVQAKWFFYSPLLESSGGLPAVKQYADDHFYLHFQDAGKTLDVGTGFWVNRP
jgi:hypothetical protein